MLCQFTSQSQQLIFVVALDPVIKPIILVVDLAPGNLKNLLLMRSPFRILSLQQLLNVRRKFLECILLRFGSIRGFQSGNLFADIGSSGFPLF